jgi:O-acetyl-ADP-ribose deacetylase (regulator of RNase III)
MLESFLDGRVIIKVGDLTEENVDAIVNAANSTLLGGGGVDGAIHAKGGPAILAECRQIRVDRYPNGLPTGEVVITTAGDLPANHVIHTVGPIYGQNGGRDAELLADAYRNSLELAVSYSLTTVAFPSISTGAYAYPRSEAALVSSATIKQFLDEDHAIAEVRLVFFSVDDASVFLSHHKF